MQPKAAVLAIGTELTNGQITNRNSSYVSGEILKLGFETLYHRCVPDDRPMIQSELADLAEKVEIIFVTGGLGPTTDDFTRDCIAAFMGQELIWHEDSWNWIVERMNARSQPIRDSQKQQCYYPDGAKVMWNKQGTAHGFMLNVTAEDLARIKQPKAKLQKIYVLPGPPREVEAVYLAGVRPDLQTGFPSVDGLVVRSWDCMGIGESEIALRAEGVLVGCPFDKGYRAHVPLVEFKLSYPASRAVEAQPWTEKIEEVLKDYIVLRDFETSFGNWGRELGNFRRIDIQDSITEGEILKRAVPVMISEARLAQFNYSSEMSPRNPHQHEVLFGARSLGPGHAEFFVKSADLHFKEEIAAPANYLIPTMLERQRQFFAESAFLSWTRLLSQFAH